MSAIRRHLETSLSEKYPQTIKHEKKYYIISASVGTAVKIVGCISPVLSILRKRRTMNGAIEVMRSCIVGIAIKWIMCDQALGDINTRNLWQQCRQKQK